MVSSKRGKEMNPTPTPTIPPDYPLLLMRFEPWMLMVLILAALGALLICLLMIYRYVNEVRTTVFHRQILLDAVTEYRYQKLREQTPIDMLDFGQPPDMPPPPNETPEERTQRQLRERQEEEQRKKS
jgi:hypothetical protein